MQKECSYKTVTIKNVAFLLLILLVIMGCSSGPNINDIKKEAEKELIEKGAFFTRPRTNIEFNNAAVYENNYYKVSLSGWPATWDFIGGITNINLYRTYNDKQFGALVFKWCSGVKATCDSIAHMVADGKIKAVGSVNLYFIRDDPVFRPTVVGAKTFIVFSNGIQFSTNDNQILPIDKLHEVVSAVYANERNNEDFKKYAKNGIDAVSFAKIDYEKVAKEQEKQYKNRNEKERLARIEKIDKENETRQKEYIELRKKRQKEYGVAKMSGILKAAFYDQGARYIRIVNDTGKELEIIFPDDDKAINNINIGYMEKNIGKRITVKYINDPNIGDRYIDSDSSVSASIE